MNAAIRKIQRLDRQLRGLGARPPRPTKRASDVEVSGARPTYNGVWSPIPPREDGAPSPQQLAYECEADELYYGGGAGGGKTDLELGLALTKHLRSIIFRREAEQVVGLEDRLLEVLDSDAGYNRNLRRFVGRVDGRLRRIRLAGMQRPLDWRKYQGQPYDLVAFDELPHFVRSQFRSVIGWNRTSVVGQRTRVVGAGNPPTNPEEEWVIDEFAPWLDPAFDGRGGPARPGELRWYRYVDGKPEGEDVEWYAREDLLEDEDGRLYIEEDGRRVYPKSRTFIPALVDDNPFYMATGYADTLEALPEPLRSLMRRGLFGADVEVNPWQAIPTAWVDAAMERWRELNAAGPFVPACPLTALGVDPARGGKDEFTVAERFGTYWPELRAYAGADVKTGPDGAALVVAAGVSAEAKAVVDVIGIGASVYDSLPDGVAVPFNAAEGSDARDRSGKFGMANKRAEIWWSMREALDPEHGEDLALPPDRQLRAELCAPLFKVTARGILVEAKEDVKKRIGRSTNRADAVLQSRYSPPRRVHVQRPGTVQSPY